MYKYILIPTDGSELSEKAIKPDRERCACLDHRWASARVAQYFFSRLSSIGQQVLPSQRSVNKGGLNENITIGLSDLCRSRSMGV